MPEEERRRRRSRVLEYFEAHPPQADPRDDEPFRGLDAAFGLDGSDKKDSK